MSRERRTFFYRPTNVMGDESYLNADIASADDMQQNVEKRIRAYLNNVR